MTLRPSAALVPAALALLLLAGCTSDFLVDGGAGGVAEPQPTPTTSDEASPAPTAEETAPAQEYDCDDILINRPGNYVLGDCGTVTLEGGGIDLAFGSIATLVIRGDNADVLGDTLGDVEINGQRNEIGVASIDDLVIRGEDNAITVTGAIATVVIDGNENVVTAGDGIGSSVDNGLLNEVG